ncbi:MAG: hypothetical protein KME14_26155 [Tildeniella torsiva UHER 1998/13D]|nr:hypothetical protein [Tildeniella torsiva UHER 1998/13D]
MKFIPLVQLVILFLAAIPNWYNMLKDIYQGIQRDRRRRDRQRPGRNPLFKP